MSLEGPREASPHHARSARFGRKLVCRWGTIATLAVMAACSPTPLGATEILIADPATLMPSSLLDEEVVAGEIYIVLDSRPKPSQVAFHLDDADLALPPVEVDTKEPFDLVIDTTKLPEGEHAVTAVVTTARGKTEVVTIEHATFVVDNDGDQVQPGTPAEPVEPGDPVAPADPDDPVDPADPGEPQGPEISPIGAWSLEADPGFSEANLPDEARRWHRRVWAAIENPNARYDLVALAATGNLRNYGYDFNQQMSMLFTALRATQNPEFVDLIAELADVMADQMVTKWYDEGRNEWVTPTDGTAGYRRFLYDFGSSKWNGYDTQVLATVLSHGMIANMAYVFEANRYVKSPSGIDYGAKADFWTDYLRNDFEAIWRIRTGKDWPTLPLWNHQIAHSWKSQMRWAFYMYKLTGLEPYLNAAERYAEEVLERTYVVDTPFGDGVVWSHRLREANYGLQPIAYARYEYGIEGDIALEGGLRGIDEAYMAMHAHSFAHFAMDNGAQDLAFDIGGMRSRSGVAISGGGSATGPTRNPWDDSGLTWGRESTARYLLSTFAHLGAFGARERIEDVSERIYADREADLDDPRNLAIPTGMLLMSMR